MKKLFLLLIPFTVNATQYYVDSSISSSGNGLSWGTAWKNISNITGVVGDDVVNISGGPSGTSQTYSMTTWTPISGTAGHPITYRIGQDSLHNGVAFFSGSSTYFLSDGTIQNVIISGDAGDGLKHFTIANPATGTSSWLAFNRHTSGTFANVNIGFFNLGNIQSDNESVMYFNTGGPGVVIHDTYGFCTGNALNIFFHAFSFPGQSAYRLNLVLSNNVWYTPQGGASQAGFGADGIQAQVSGASYINNHIEAYQVANYTGPNHADGLQLLTINGSQNYVELIGNTLVNYNNTTLTVENDAVNQHWRLQNNISISAINFGNPQGFAIGTGAAGASFLDIISANNTFNGPNALAYSFRSVQGGATFTGCVSANNISVGFGKDANAFQGNPNTLQVDDVYNVSGANFVNYVAQTTNSDFHLKAAASTLIGQGTNMSSIFTIDKDGNTRSLTQPWDLGVYVFSTNLPPSSQLSPVHLRFHL